MSRPARQVVITGIGLVTSLGVGREHHATLLAAGKPLEPVIDRDWQPPYPIHPMPQIDWSEQIPRRGDQRQMENWQRLGVFAAGLALDDAGLKDDAEACASMDMIVAAGGGERDVAVDSLIVEEARTRNDHEILLNEKLTTELRPTLFLAQLSNLMAGNISIVHKVTGSSRTFMGEEGAGVSAVETAFARIAAGQSSHCLVGGAFIAERLDVLLTFATGGASAGQAAKPSEGLALGSAAAFLILESLEHAQARGARIYARLDQVEGDRGSRDGDAFEDRLARLACDVVPANADPVPLIISGANSQDELSARERSFLAERFPAAVLRNQSSAFGHGVEAQFPVAMALAAIAVSSGNPVAAFDPSEAAMNSAAHSALVTSIGPQRGEGFARISALG